jgi:putative phosphoribosyl transferase
VEIASEYLEVEKKRQLEILRRRRALYTPSRMPIDAHDRLVIVVNDGIAAGSTEIATLRAVRAREPKELVGAVAVALPEAARALLREPVAMVYLTVPARFYAAREFFEDFSRGSDQDVIAILGEKESQAPSAS